MGLTQRGFLIIFLDVFGLGASFQFFSAIYVAMDRTQVGCLQGKCPSYCTIFSSQGFVESSTRNQPNLESLQKIYLYIKLVENVFHILSMISWFYRVKYHLCWMLQNFLFILWSSVHIYPVDLLIFPLVCIIGHSVLICPRKMFTIPLKTCSFTLFYICHLGNLSGLSQTLFLHSSIFSTVSNVASTSFDIGFQVLPSLHPWFPNPSIP